MKLTPAMARDLRKCIRVYDAAATSRCSSRLPTGKALAARGLVVIANQYSANRYPKWQPTIAGRLAVGGAA